jgi:dipeptidyl aminopeptidase/acylaminoacyl peptidase
MKPLSEPVALADGVRGATNGVAAASVSSSVLAYRPGRQGGGRQFRWFSRTGKEEQTATPVGDLGIVEMSPDGHKALIAISSGQARDLFLLDLATGVLSALTSDPAIETDPVWSPDSRRIVFSRDGDKAGLYHMVLGSGKATLVYPNTQRLEAWTSEGLLTRDRVLALVPAPEENVSGPITAKPRVLAELPNTDQFRVSPDGKWVTFTSGGTDRAAEAREVWVAAFPSFTDRRKIANGEAPLWRADGKELVFLSPGAGLMSASVKPGVTLEVGPPKLLFNPAAAPIENAQGHNYALSNDGNRLLLRVDTSDKGNEAEPLHVILNWQSLLK